MSEPTPDPPRQARDPESPSEQPTTIAEPLRPAPRAAEPGMSSARPPEAPPEPPEVVPQLVDRYRILEELGHGGMGRVFLAERADGAFRQRLAVKLLRSGRLAGEDARRRFVAERQILARLAHPSIARLIDGGTTATGEPYLAMEYVEGRPIDDYCRDEGLGVDAILRLVLEVCEAVEAAHRSLIVHRDLKPSNILVTPDGEPKLLDFGIAKLLDPELDQEMGGHTRVGHAPLTLRYAAPEQVRGEPVTVATDVYSLGVVLYELLTGSSPYRAAGADPLAYARAVCEQEPTAPSTAVSRIAETAAGTTIAPVRRLSRDLDAIVLKALRKEAALRYGSIGELAADLERYLGGLPVEARRGSRLYRLGKFVRRRAVPLAAAAAFVALVVAFAVERQRELRRTAAERDRAQKVTEFLVDLFELSDPSEARGNAMTVREALDRGAVRIDDELAGQPATRATLLETVGRVYQNLGLNQKGGALLERAVALRRHGGTPAELANALLLLARSQQVDGKLDLASKNFREALEQAHTAGDRTLEAHVVGDLARVRLDQGQYDETDRLFVQAYGLLRSLSPVDALDLAENRSGLAVTRQNRGDPTGAKGVIAAADSWLARAKDEDPIRHAMIEGELAIAERGLGEVGPGAVRLDREIARLRRILPGDHAELANLLNTRAILHADAGELPASIATFEQSRAMWSRLVGEEHPRTALATSNLGVLYLRRGDWARAAELIGSGLATDRRVLGEDHPDVAMDYENLADVALEQGDLSKARHLLAQSEAIVTRAFQPPHPALARLHARQARHLERRGELVEAERLARSALADYQATSAVDAPPIAAARLIVARVLLARGEAAEARPLLEDAVASRVRALGENHYDTAAAKSLLGGALLATGDPGRAEPLLREALAVQEAALLPGHFLIAETRERLARVELARGRDGEARALLDQAIRDLRAAFPAGHALLPRLERERDGIGAPAGST